MKRNLLVFWITGGLHLCSLMTISHAQAQSIQIDGTTPTTPGTCTGDCTIEGGLQHGSNLFHSFSRFNVDSGATVHFRDPGVTNILSRVTGNDLSNIEGILGILGGSANLFLMNPNGILFGPNASLDIRGSFVATTANAIQFGNQGFFRATSASEIPVLTVNPSALRFTQRTGSIENRSTAPAGLDPSDLAVSGLKVPDGQSLLLVGGDVILNGGGLNAFGGQVELGGLSEPGVIGLENEGSKLRLRFPNSVARADVVITDDSKVNVTSDGGGDIVINARNIDISGNSEVRAGIAGGVGTVGSQAGDINLNATGAITVTKSDIFNRVRGGFDIPENRREDVGKGIGNAGSIYVDAEELSLNESSLSTSTFGQGGAGLISIDVSGNIVLISSLILSSVDEAIGNGGDINIRARNLFLREESGLESNIFFSGQGDAGKISIHVSDDISLESDSLVGSQVAFGGVGDSGDIEFHTSTLSIKDGAQIASSVFREVLLVDGTLRPGGQGKAGNVLIDALDSVSISGFGANGFSSGVSTETQLGAVGPAGNIIVNTDAFRIADGAIVSARTSNESDGGNITINATIFEAVNGGQILTTASGAGDAGSIEINVTDSLTLTGGDPNFSERLNRLRNTLIDRGVDLEVIEEEDIQPLRDIGPNSGLFANTTPDSTGNAGSIFVDPQTVLIQDGARIAVNSEGSGVGGDIELQAGSLTLDNGEITAATASGDGGNVRLNIDDTLLMQRNSEISARAEGPGDGGNVELDAEFVIAALNEDNDIIASAEQGDGGQITITTRELFGLEERAAEPGNGTNDIDASSEFGLDGVVVINTPEVDPSEELVELPANAIDVSSLVSQGCARGREIRTARDLGEFFVTGRGGLPPSPGELVNSEDVLADWVALEPEAGSAQGSEAQLSTQIEYSESKVKVAELPEATPAKIVEAQGWVVGPDGEVVLVAQAPTATSQSLWSALSSCQASETAGS